MKRTIVALLALSIGVSAHAANRITVTGDVERLQIMGRTYLTVANSGDALVFIYMDELPVACGNSYNLRRAVVASTHPAFEAVLSAALAARASGQTISLSYLDECTTHESGWDFSILYVE